jgi:hypothetical protein
MPDPGGEEKPAATTFPGIGTSESRFDGQRPRNSTPDSLSRMSLIPAYRRDDSIPAVLAGMAFAGLAAVTAVRLLLGLPHAVSFHICAAAVLDWWAGQDPYGTGFEGFLYLPANLVLFTPFALLGPKVGGALWCLLSAGLYASGIIRLAWLVSPQQARLFILGASLFATLPSVNANLSDGQPQVIMTGLVLHAAADIAYQKYWRSAALLGLVAAFKPLALAPLLIVFAMLPRSRLPLLVACLAILLLPLLHPSPRFAMLEYARFAEKMRTAGAPPPGAWPWFADIGTFLRMLGIVPGQIGELVIRGIAALGALALALYARRLAAPIQVTTLLVLGLTYLTVFSPRTESVSYVALTPMLGLSASLLLARDRRCPAGWLLFFAALALGVAWGRGVDPWLKPLLGLVFVLYWLRMLLSSRALTSAFPMHAPGSAGQPTAIAVN